MRSLPSGPTWRLFPVPPSDCPSRVYQVGAKRGRCYLVTVHTVGPVHCPVLRELDTAINEHMPRCMHVEINPSKLQATAVHSLLIRSRPKSIRTRLDSSYKKVETLLRRDASLTHQHTRLLLAKPLRTHTSHAAATAPTATPHTPHATRHTP
jgi:hypothetical protein